MAQNKPKDHYKILGIAHTASEKELKSAYRSLARKYHPDVNQGNKDSEEKFKEVTEAYSFLSDEKQRYLFDLAQGYKKINNDQQKQPQHQTKRNPTQAPSKKPDTSKEKPSKDSTFSDTFSNLFESIMKGGEQQQNKRKPSFTTEPPPKKKEKATYSDIVNKPLKHRKSVRGNDITLDIYLMVNEAKNGIVRTVNILHTDPCQKCKGSGILASSKCQYCEGKGESSIHKKLDVKIPAGVKNGAKVRISKEGNKGVNDGERGDLYLIIKVYNPANFEFDQFDVLSEVIISPHEAVLGTEIQVLTIDGFVKMKIPPATQQSQKFRMVKQGLPDKTGGRGNHFVQIKIEIPSKLSDREKELYEEIAKISKFNPREYVD